MLIQVQKAAFLIAGFVTGSEKAGLETVMTELDILVKKSAAVLHKSIKDAVNSANIKE